MRNDETNTLQAKRYNLLQWRTVARQIPQRCHGSLLNTRIRGPQQRDEVLDGASDGGDRDQVRICTQANQQECAHALSQNMRNPRHAGHHRVRNDETNTLQDRWYYLLQWRTVARQILQRPRGSRLNTRIRGPQQSDEVLDGTSDGGDCDLVRICTHANNKERAHALSQNSSKKHEMRNTTECAMMKPTHFKQDGTTCCSGAPLHAKFCSAHAAAS